MLRIEVDENTRTVTITYMEGKTSLEEIKKELDREDFEVVGKPKFLR